MKQGAVREKTGRQRKSEQLSRPFKKLYSTKSIISLIRSKQTTKQWITEQTTQGLKRVL